MPEPFNHAEFQAALAGLRKESDWRPERYTLAIAEQVEANRQAIEELSKQVIKLRCDRAYKPGEAK